MKELPEILRVLCDGSVEFVLIGGAAMHLQGSAYVTQDLDFCYARSPTNCERLAAALAPFHPKLRGAPSDLRFSFDARTIAHGLNFTLVTDLGDLHFLGEVAGLGSYAEVKAAAETKLIENIPVQVLSLSGLIRSKRAMGRAKDLYVLPELEGLEQL